MKWVRQANQGRKILHDWLGESGQPVPPAEAQARANICLQCPYNYQGSWVWNLATSIAIARQMQLREIMKLKLEGEEKLNICEKCGCKLKLKVHTPFHHLYRHTSDEQFAKFPLECWQRIEFEKIKRP